MGEPIIPSTNQKMKVIVEQSGPTSFLGMKNLGDGVSRQTSIVPGWLICVLGFVDCPLHVLQGNAVLCFRLPSHHEKKAIHGLGKMLRTLMPIPCPEPHCL